MVDHIVCRIFGHRRSRSRAVLERGTWSSMCKRCGVRLVRVQHSRWRESAKVDLEALRPELLRYLDGRYVTAAEEATDF